MIVWENEQFYGINKFDCHNVDLRKYEKGGGYFTVLPISPLEYRRNNPTKAKVELIEKFDFTSFIITDDWGTERTMIIPNQFTHEIAYAKKSAIESELLRP